MRVRSASAEFIANRLLIALSLAGVLATFFVVADWMTKAGFSSQIDIGAAVAAALATGMAFQANSRRVVRLVDRIFLPRRYRAAVALDCVRASLRNGPPASRERVAADVAEALGVTSVAVFIRAFDGGFVRRAAFGWPRDSAWHLLPGEALTASLTVRANVVPLPFEAQSGDGLAFPQARARPRVGVTLRRRGRVESAILLGPDSSGAAPDLDTVRGLAAVLGEMLGV